MKYSLRGIRPGEAAEMLKIARSNFSIVEQIFMSKPKMGIVAETEKEEIMGGTFLLIVERGGEKVGCIDIIFVLPKYRGSGVAKQLYHAAVEKLHQCGCKTVTALVRGDNSKSLCRFEAEGLHPVSLHGLRKKIGTGAVMELFKKSDSLACATGCWILCEHTTEESIGGSGKNMLRTFWINGLILFVSALLWGGLLGAKNTCWSLIAAFAFLIIITAGETLGRMVAGGDWRFVLPEGGLVPTTLVALLSGFYPMLGHWYVAKRENSSTYRKRMAMPAKFSWFAVIITTVLCYLVGEQHPIFSGGTDVGVMLLLFNIIPCYPFDTFASRRIKEEQVSFYNCLMGLSFIIVVAIQFGTFKM